MLLMVCMLVEVDMFLKFVWGWVKMFVQIEIVEFVEQCVGLIDFGWDYVFIGLNDLMILCGGYWLWELFYDGMVEKIFCVLFGCQVGFGGIMVIGGGYLLLFIELFCEFFWLGVMFSFMWWIFYCEMVGCDFVVEFVVVQVVWMVCNWCLLEIVVVDYWVF